MIAKKKNQISDTPSVGSVVLFWNGSRMHHTELVTEVNIGKDTFTTIGGNTGMSSSTVVPNGGGVAMHVFSISGQRSKGTKFMVPNYGVNTPVSTEFVPHWESANGNYYQRESKGINAKNKQVKDKDQWYFVNGEGVMMHDTWFKENKNGKEVWSYLTTTGAALCSQWMQDKGEWYYLGPDCYMITSQWLQYKDQWYYLCKDGKMAANAYVLSKDGTCFYYLDANGICDNKQYKGPQVNVVV